MTQNPETHKSRDPLYVQLKELQGQQYGISPKLALHAELGRQIEAIKEKLGGNGVSNFRKDTEGPIRAASTLKHRNRRGRTRVV